MSEVIRTYPSGVHEGWKAEFAAFGQISGIELRGLRMTDDPAAMIEAHCQLESTGLSTLEVAQELERIWVNEIIFPSDLERHFLSVTAEEIVLEAFTIHRNRSITAKVIVTSND